MKKFLTAVFTVLIIGSACFAGCMGGSTESVKEEAPETKIITEEEAPSEDNECPDGDCKDGDCDKKFPKPRRNAKRRREEGDAPRPPRQPRPIPKTAEPIN